MEERHTGKSAELGLGQSGGQRRSSVKKMERLMEKVIFFFLFRKMKVLGRANHRKSQSGFLFFRLVCVSNGSPCLCSLIFIISSVCVCVCGCTEARQGAGDPAQVHQGSQRLPSELGGVQRGHEQVLPAGRQHPHRRTKQHNCVSVGL